MSVRSVYPINQGHRLQERLQLVPNNPELYSCQFAVRRQEDGKSCTASITLKGNCANAARNAKSGKLAQEMSSSFLFNFSSACLKPPTEQLGNELRE